MQLSGLQNTKKHTHTIQRQNTKNICKKADARQPFVHDALLDVNKCAHCEHIVIPIAVLSHVSEAFIFKGSRNARGARHRSRCLKEKGCSGYG